ncbi:MAG: putative addiction module component [Verrucomicrobiales bacterium]|nr:putative addiction module component [Verrucomicrobiales bacterium]
MNAALQHEALTLPDTDKAKLIDALWDSLSSSELKKREAACAAESERRIEAYNAGLLKARSAEDVLADLKKRFK